MATTSFASYVIRIWHAGSAAASPRVAIEELRTGHERVLKGEDARVLALAIESGVGGWLARNAGAGSPEPSDGQGIAVEPERQEATT